MPGERRAELEPLSTYELEQLSDEEKRDEAWLLSVQGWSMAKIGRRFGVGPTSVGRWLDRVGQDRRSRAENIERETERIIGVLEAVAAKSWELADRDAGPGSMAPASHLKNVIESAKEIARLRGIEGTRRDSGGIKVTEVIVNIGGAADRPPVIDVTATTHSSPELERAS